MIDSNTPSWVCPQLIHDSTNNGPMLRPHECESLRRDIATLRDNDEPHVMIRTSLLERLVHSAESTYKS